jgi:hypothetical protein
MVAVLAASMNVTSSAHEISVHRRITNAAIDYLVKFRPELATPACTSTLKLKLGEGVEREDDYYSWPMGRFFFHFQPILDDTPKTLIQARSWATCSADQWAHDAGSCQATVFRVAPPVTLGFTGDRANESRFDLLTSRLLASPGTPTHDQGLVDLGHYIHLLQDLASPGHTRVDAHPHPDSGNAGIDEWLGDPSLFETMNTGSAINLPAENVDGLITTWPTVRTAFADLQAFTSSNFYSEANVGSVLKGGVPARVSITPDGYAIGTGGRLLAHRGSRFDAFKINRRVARAQFVELSKAAVLYTASLINHIIMTQNIALCSVTEKPVLAYYQVYASGVGEAETPKPLPIDGPPLIKNASGPGAQASASAVTSRTGLTATATSATSLGTGYGYMELHLSDTVTVNGPPGAAFSLALKINVAGNAGASGKVFDSSGTVAISWGQASMGGSGCVSGAGVTASPPSGCTCDGIMSPAAPDPLTCGYPSTSPAGQPVILNGVSGASFTVNWAVGASALTGVSSGVNAPAATASAGAQATFVITNLTPGFTVTSSKGMNYFAQ